MVYKLEGADAARVGLDCCVVRSGWCCNKIPRNMPTGTVLASTGLGMSESVSIRTQTLPEFTTTREFF